MRLFEEIKAAGYAGGYTQVKEYVRKVRPRAPEEPVVRFETPPGHQGQVDFADFRLPWGKRYAFLVVLGFSRVLWLQFFTRQTMLHVFEGLEAAFTFFGGVPRELLFDQMKAVVTKDERAAGGRVTENAEFLRFAHHWDFRVRACRPYSGRGRPPGSAWHRRVRGISWRPATGMRPRRSRRPRGPEDSPTRPTCCWRSDWARPRPAISSWPARPRPVS